jgi:hypothetical protein
VAARTQTHRRGASGSGDRGQSGARIWRVMVDFEH